MARFQRERFAGGVAQAFELDHAARRREGKPRRGFGLAIKDLGEKDPGGGGQAAAGHLFRIAHQLIEMDFRSGDECADSAAALDDPFALERGERVASGHQADLVNLREVALGSDGVPRLQLPRINALADRALDPLVRRHTVAVLG